MANNPTPTEGELEEIHDIIYQIRRNELMPNVGYTDRVACEHIQAAIRATADVLCAERVRAELEDALHVAEGCVIAAPVMIPANSRRIYEEPGNNPKGFPVILDRHIQEHGDGLATVANTYALRDAILYFLRKRFNDRLAALRAELGEKS